MSAGSETVITANLCATGDECCEKVKYSHAGQ